jgi:hypothetical protein
MANVNSPRGFTPVKMADGKPYCGIGNRYYKDTTAGAIGIGDPVIRVVSSSDPLGGPEIVRATTGAAITGVVVGIEPNRSDLSKLYLAAGDTGYVLVEDDPNVIFEVQEGGSGTQLAVTDVGKHIDSVTALDCDTVTGRSKYQIDNNAKATDNTWIIKGLSSKPDNAVGQYAKWLVQANLHTEVNASATNHTEI